MTVRRGHHAWRPGLALLVAGLLTSDCGRPSSDQHPQLVWTLSPAQSVVGPAVLSVQLHQPSGAPATGATVTLEAHMSHAGMGPVLASATEPTPGLYALPFTFTMPGDWVLLVSTVLPDGTRVEQRIDVANVRPSG